MRGSPEIQTTDSRLSRVFGPWDFGAFRRLARGLFEETRALRLQHSFPRVAVALCQAWLTPRCRALLYRCLGIRVGSGTLVAGALRFAVGEQRFQDLRIGARCFINCEVFLDAAGAIHIGDGVSLGHHVVIITTNHEIGPPEFRAGRPVVAPVNIGSGAWLGAGVTVLPGVSIGEGAVIGAGAVVTRDIPPHTLALGVPATPVRSLPGALQ